ncbi:MAG TPA: oligosaccharide flippase family protein [Elusimicrobiota bacterium]|nr:oligosaccharide flippase family protein [Elusimicrobiota bacterium]
MGVPLSKTITRNTLYSAYLTALQFVVGLVMVPYLVFRLGLDYFGIWSTVFAVAGYLGFIDLGASTSFVPYFAAAAARKDEQEFNRVFNTGLLFYGAAALMLTLAAPFLAGELLDLLKIPPPLRGDTRFALTWAIWIYVYGLWAGVFRSVLVGFQRMDISNRIEMGLALAASAGAVLVLELGFGLRGLILSRAVVVFGASLFTLRAALKMEPIRPRFSPRLFSVDMLKKCFAYGVNTQISYLCSMGTLYLANIVIARYLGLAAVGVYEIGRKIAQTARSLPMVLLPALVPASADLYGRSDGDKLMRLYRTGSKYMSAVTVPLAAFLVFQMERIVRVWVGPGYGPSVLIGQVLVAAYLFNMLTGVPGSIARGIDQVRLEARSSTVVLFLTVLFMGAAVRSDAGLAGFAVAIWLAMSTGTLYFIVLAHRKIFHIPVGPFLAQMLLKPSASCLAAGAVSAGLFWIFPPPGGRFAEGLALATVFSVFAAAFMLLLHFVRYFDAEETRIIFSAWRQLKSSDRR